MLGVVAGLLTAICGVGLFIGGFICGRKFSEPTSVQYTPAELEKIRLERERLQEDQTAFTNLLNYNTDMAYQVGGKNKR